VNQHIYRRMIVDRCPWAANERAIAYHDAEWGVPLHDDRALFEMLTLEGAQAGLSWDTILRKREAYRTAFASFEPRVVAAFGEPEEERLMGDVGIVRNRLKIASTIVNARALVDIQERFGTFDSYIWRFTEGSPIHNCWSKAGEVPASTPLSYTVSKELKRLGFKFVGATICYSFMQATGMVNDHLRGCFRYADLANRA
jgi:DNA-3-methyladenine glycosylase I